MGGWNNLERKLRQGEDCGVMASRAARFFGVRNEMSREPVDEVWFVWVADSTALTGVSVTLVTGVFVAFVTGGSVTLMTGVCVWLLRGVSVTLATGVYVRLASGAGEAIDGGGLSLWTWGCWEVQDVCGRRGGSCSDMM